MKKIFVLVLAIVTIMGANAQKKRTTVDRKDLRDKMLTERLSLSEEQKQKAKALDEDYRKKMTELKKKEDITVKEWRDQMMELNKKHREVMRGLLGNDQKEQIEKMKLRLDLNNEQMEKIKKQRSEMLEKMKAIHENKSLDMMKKREETKALLQQRKEHMKSILTEEQQKKMQERNKLMKRKRRVLS